MAGEPDTDALLDRLTHRQVARWYAYFNQIGSDGDLRTGKVAAAVENIGKAFGGDDEWSTPHSTMELPEPPRIIRPGVVGEGLKRRQQSKFG